MTTASMRLNSEKIIELIKPGGICSQYIKFFEPREQQQQMLQTIIDVFNQDKIALIEAGTGTGKSLAYLLPAICWSVQEKQRILISTHTITLQEQLLKKDIPLAAQALQVKLKAVLVKGMNNYLCIRKLEETALEKRFLDTNEKVQIETIEKWANNTKDGSKSSLPMVPSTETWEKVCAESDTCNKNQCPYFKDCHFFRARRNAEDAQILVANHHLLFADLTSDSSILPQYEKVIIDEAHHIEDVATEYFASKASKYNMIRIVGRLQSEKGGKSLGKLPQLKEKILNYYQTRNTPEQVQKILQLISIDLPPLRHDLLKEMVDAFDAYLEFMQALAIEDRKKRILNEHRKLDFWIEEITPVVSRLIDITQRYLHILEEIETLIKSIDDQTLNYHTDGIRHEILAMATRLAESLLTLSNFTVSEIQSKQVRWIESHKMKSMINARLVDAKLDISEALDHHLFDKFSTVILTSATLTSNKDFTFIRGRLGLHQELPVIERIYDSPFNYQEQTLLAIPSDLPPPNDPKYQNAASGAILKAIESSNGNAFVLFTSYSMMAQCYALLEQPLKKQKFNLFRQGELNRQELLTDFKQTNRSVLFGTDSFWEGVDVVGDALRCVILVKLPFQVPSEPLVEARAEAITNIGGDAFWEYSLPNAIVKFKQGFGRLIRNKTDRGVVICLDTRILTKSYGKLFLKSLPPCRQYIGTAESLWIEMKNFYRKTHFLTRN